MSRVFIAIFIFSISIVSLGCQQSNSAHSISFDKSASPAKISGCYRIVGQLVENSCGTPGGGDTTIFCLKQDDVNSKDLIYSISADTNSKDGKSAAAQGGFLSVETGSRVQSTSSKGVEAQVEAEAYSVLSDVGGRTFWIDEIYNFPDGDCVKKINNRIDAELLSADGIRGNWRYSRSGSGGCVNYPPCSCLISFDGTRRE